MEIKKLQIGLLDWFWFEPNGYKTISTIENICMKLYEQYYPNKKAINARYEIFYKLLKYGLLEFYGDKQFALSPTCCLIREHLMLTCNLPMEVRQLLLSEKEFDTNMGIEVYKNSNNNILILRNHSVTCTSFLFSNLLRQITSFEKIIQRWSKTRVSNTKGFQYFDNNYTWNSNFKETQIGVYRMSSKAFSQKIVKTNDFDWHIIPTRNDHIDAFNVAIFWSACKTKSDIKIKYFEGESKLVINNIFFPIVIERLLFVNTILAGKYNFDFSQGHYFLTKTDFKILNKFFNNMIVIV